jgi:hypothetical protein
MGASNDSMQLQTDQIPSLINVSAPESPKMGSKDASSDSPPTKPIGVNPDGLGESPNQPDLAPTQKRQEEIQDLALESTALMGEH